MREINGRNKMLLRTNHVIYKSSFYWGDVCDTTMDWYVCRLGGKNEKSFI